MKIPENILSIRDELSEKYLVLENPFNIHSVGIEILNDGNVENDFRIQIGSSQKNESLEKGLEVAMRSKGVNISFVTETKPKIISELPPARTPPGRRPSDDKAITCYCNQSGCPNKTAPYAFKAGVRIKNSLSEGSLGWFCVNKNDSSLKYLVSNNHVLSQINRTTIWDPNFPTTLQNSTISDNTICKELIFHPHSDPKNCDVAVSRLINPSNFGSSFVLQNLGNLNGLSFSFPNPKGVQKFGSATCLTTGSLSVIANTLLKYSVNGKEEKAYFFNQLKISANKPFVLKGDSGSILLTKNGLTSKNKKILGLLYAGGQDSNNAYYAYAHPIEHIVDWLAGHNFKLI